MYEAPAMGTAGVSVAACAVAPATVVVVAPATAVVVVPPATVVVVVVPRATVVVVVVEVLVVVVGATVAGPKVKLFAPPPGDAVIVIAVAQYFSFRIKRLEANFVQAMPIQYVPGGTVANDAPENESWLGALTTPSVKPGF